MDTREKTMSKVGEFSHRTEETSRGVADTVRDTARDVGGAIAGAAGQVRDKAQEWAGAVGETAEDVGQGVVDFIRSYPVPTLLGAAAVGFVLGRLTSMRSY